MNKTKKIIKEYDEAYFAERDYLPCHLLNVIEILLRQNSIHSVLEVGVGSGKLMNKLKDLGYNVNGIDISSVAAKLVGATIASATDIPYPNNQFDCVLGISIIEHLTERDGKKFINEAHRVLKKDGIILLVTPNFSSPLRYIQGKNWFGYSDKTHVFFYTPNNLSNMLQKNGFKDIRLTFKIRISSLEWYLPSVFYKLPTPFKYLINYLLVSSPIALFRDSFWISGRKIK